MNRTHHLVISTLLLAAVRGQEQATTLLQLAARAEVVAVATAAAPADPAPDRHGLQFAVAEVLQGDLSAALVLDEPAGRCCGRALFAIAPGSTQLLFLERRGAALHVLAADRGVEPATPALLAHVRDLLRHRAQPRELTRLLATALDHPLARVRDDAAFALATLPTPVGDAQDAERIRQALLLHVDPATTRLPALATALVRLDPRPAADTLVAAWLAARTADSRTVLAAAMRHAADQTVLDALQATALRDDAERLLALDLLATRPAPASLPFLERLLAEATTPRLQLAATEALLAHGIAPATLQTRVPASVLGLAVRRRAAVPTFRAVRPEARR